MCEPKNFGSVNCDAAKQWVEDFQKLSKNIPSGVSLVAVCSSAINKDQGMSISQVFGKKKDIIEMLVRLLDSNDAIHELFFDSQKIQKMTNTVMNGSMKDVIDAIKNFHFKG